MATQFELLADCPRCNIDGAVVELYDPHDPAGVMGIPAESRCRMCGAAWAGRVAPGPDSKGVGFRGSGHCPGCSRALTDEEVEAHACCMCGARGRSEETSAGVDLRDYAVFLDRLACFADEEHETDIAAFTESNFTLGSVDAVHAAVLRGERVETAFDAMFSLFHRGAGHGGAMRAGQRGNAVPKPAPRVAHDPRAMLLALVSVLVADGKQDPRELAFLDRFLKAEGMGPLEPKELKVHRPVEVAGRIPPERRAEVVELMAQLACIDGETDPSEVRLLSSYASAWGIADEDVRDWLARYRHRYATDVQRFFKKLKSFFLAPKDETPAHAGK